MNKVISLAAIIALSAASEDFADNDLNILKTIGHDLKKAGEFVVQHPKIITTAAKFLDDEAVAITRPIYRIPEHSMLFSDEELNILTTIKNDAKKAGHFIAEHPELITKAAEVYKTLHKDDDVENELNIFKKIGDGLKKAGQFVVQHPQIITTAAKFLDDEAENELNVWTTIKNDAKKVGNFVADHPQVITEAAKVIKTLKHDDEVDNELAINENLEKMVRGLKILTHRDDEAENELNVLKTIGHDLKKAGEFVVQHPKIITTAAKFLDSEAENELNVWTTIKNDAKKVGHFVADHPQVVTEAVKAYKTLKHDDEVDNELNVWTTIKNDAKKVGNFVADHPQVVTEAAKVIKTLKHDDEADNELNFFKKIGDGLKKAGNFVISHPQIITTAAKFLDDDELFAHERVEQRAHEGVKKAQRDVRAATEALKNSHHAKRAGAHDSLSSLGELLHEGHRIHHAHKKIAEVQDNHLSIKDKLKGAANWVGDHPQVITEAANTYKILKGKK